MIDNWTVEPEAFLYEMTFPEVLKATKHVGDHTGIIWAGRSRKGLNAPNPTDLFLKWQKSVQWAGREGKVTQRVEDYFQATKHLSRPPKRGEIVDNPVDNPVDNLEEKSIEPLKPEAPRFTWSPSKIMQFDTCPFQFAAQNYYKTLPYTETEATIWGTRVHKAAEDFMNGLPVTDPEGFAPVEKWCKMLSKVEGKRLVEYKMAVDSGFKEAEWDEAEGRMILDLGILKPDGELLLVDWKTGKVKDDTTQMKIYAFIAALRFPEVKKVSYKYIWVKHDKITGGELERKDLFAVAKELQGKLKRMREAWDNETWEKRRSGLCRQWCACVECPQRGK